MEIPVNTSIFNNETAVKEMKKEMSDCITDNKNGKVEPTILWGTI